jgi:hypothetical protein
MESHDGATGRWSGVRGRASLEEAGHWGRVLGGYGFPGLFLYSLYLLPSAPSSRHHDVLPYHRLRVNKAKDGGLKPKCLIT